MSAPQVEMSEKFERYDPKNPLPDEIRALPTDETVCKFCGVSYLIHNEIKKLELELKRVQSQLVGYEEMKTNYCALEADNRSLRDELETMEKRSLQQERIVGDLEKTLTEKTGQCQALKEEYSGLSERWEEQNVLLKDQKRRINDFRKLASFYPPMKKQLSILKNQREQLKEEIAEHRNVFDEKIKLLTTYFSILSSKCQDSETQLQQSLDKASFLDKRVTELTKTNKDQEEQLTKQRDKLSVLERSSNSLNHAQQQNVQLSKLVSETQMEMETCKQDLAATVDERENLRHNFLLKNEENSELKKRINELTKRHTSQIEDLNKKYQSSLEIQTSLKTKINSHVQNMVKDKEHIASQTAKLESENMELKTELHRLTKDLGTIEERTRHISETHRLQLSELHVSYQEQLQSALASSDTYKCEIQKLEDLNRRRDAELKNALKQAREKHEHQMRTLENTYKQSHIDLENQIDNLSSQYSKDLRSKEQAIKDIERSFSLQFDTLRSDKESLQNVVNQLNAQIAEYEKTIKMLECRPAEPVDESEQLRSLRKRNTELEGEVLVLQRTVQKECEERLELTEKMDELRSQVSERKTREISGRHSRNSSCSSQHNLINSRPKVANGINRNAKNSQSSKKKAVKNYSSWLQK